MAPTSFPERLVGARRAQGFSQREMAERIGIDPRTIQDWETGRHRPSPKKLKLVERVLGKFEQGKADYRNPVPTPAEFL
jgi:transcriptional regulator with XRE-family HTH domain